MPILTKRKWGMITSIRFFSQEIPKSTWINLEIYCILLLQNRVARSNINQIQLKLLYLTIGMKKTRVSYSLGHEIKKVSNVTYISKWPCTSLLLLQNTLLCLIFIFISLINFWKAISKCFNSLMSRQCDNSRIESSCSATADPFFQRSLPSAGVIMQVD